MQRENIGEHTDRISSSTERPFHDISTEQLFKDASLLAPLVKRDSSDDNTSRILGSFGIYDAAGHKLSEFDDTRVRRSDVEEYLAKPSGNSKTIAETAHDTRVREDYRKQVEKALNQDSLSASINHGEGYYQVLGRMFSGMKPGELNSLANEVKHANGNKHILHKGQHFDLLSDEQKKLVLGNIMNDYDRAHGAVGLNDSKLDPTVAKMADRIKMDVEKAAEPALKASLEKSLRVIFEPKTEDSKKDPATDKSTQAELPFEQRVEKTVDTLQTGFENIRRSLELAEFIKKTHSADSNEYGWAVAKLGDQMNEQQKAIQDFKSLCKECPEDKMLSKQLEQDIHRYLKQKLLIVRKLHDTSIDGI